MKVLVDCHGADAGVSVAVDGALAALKERKTLVAVLCGKKEDIEKCLEGKEYDAGRLTVKEAGEPITNDDAPALAIRRKKDSSMVLGLRALAAGDADAMVSAGNTGSLLVGTQVIVKLIEGVTRATLASVISTIKDTHTIIVDSGANVDCRPEMLEEFAIMGNVYMRNVFGIAKPMVGLLSNGAEEEKGPQSVKEAHALLKKGALNFVGNVEARDVLTGAVDVLVADGFAGNVAIKACEGMGKAMFSLIKDGIMQGGLRAKIGYLLLKPVFRGVKKKVSADEVGGGIFLGANKIVIKTHGSSSAVSFCKSILNADTLAEKNVVGQIAEGLAARA